VDGSYQLGFDGPRSFKIYRQEVFNDSFEDKK
jgi:hypothetical protein